MHACAKALTVKASDRYISIVSIGRIPVKEKLQGFWHLSTVHLYQPCKNNMIGNTDPS